MKLSNTAEYVYKLPSNTDPPEDPTQAAGCRGIHQHEMTVEFSDASLPSPKNPQIIKAEKRRLFLSAHSSSCEFITSQTHTH